MKRVLGYLAVSLVLAGCIDDGRSPTSIAPTPSADGSDGIPLPKMSVTLPPLRGARIGSSGQGSFDLVALGENPLEVIPVYSMLPFSGGPPISIILTDGSFATGLMAGNLPAGFFGPTPVAAIFDVAMTIGDLPFPGEIYKLNKSVVAIGRLMPDPDPTVPIVADLFRAIYWELPLLPGATDGTPTDMGGGLHPVVVGNNTDAGGHSVGVIWTYNSGTHQYDVVELERSGDETAAYALNPTQGVIVGQRNGHPARWVTSGAQLNVETTTGEFRDVNKLGVAIGTNGDGIGIVSPGQNNVVTIDGFWPTAISDQGYMIGTTATGTGLRLITGVIRPLSSAGGPFTGVPTFLSNDGLIGGGFSVDPDFMIAATWSFPTSGDSDRDMVPNAMDNCPSVKNPLQEDTNTNFVGDICEAGNPPTIDVTSATSVTTTEGKVVTSKASATDPMGRKLTFSWSYSDGSPGTLGGTSKHIFDDEGSYTATLTVSNGYDNVTQDFTFDVTNVAPKIMATVDKTGSVGHSVQISVDINDPGLADIVAYTLDYGDGSPGEIDTCGGHACSVNRVHTYGTVGKKTVTITATDNDGAVTTVTKSVTIYE